MNHIVISTVPAWSHVRQLCVFATKIVAERAVIVTILVPHWKDTVDKVSAELKRCLLDIEPKFGSLRVIAVGSHSVDPRMIVRVDVASFEPVWTKLIDGQPLTCSATSIEYPAAPRPLFTVLDGLQDAWFPIVRRLSPTLDILMWIPEFSGYVLRVIMPNCRGGVGDTMRSNWTIEEIKTGTLRKMEGKVVQFGDLPAMYDWEYNPQAIPTPAAVWFAMENRFAKAASEADGFITPGAAGCDGQGTLDALSEWFKTEHPDRRRPTYHLGPLVPLISGTTEFPAASMKAEMDAAPGDVGSRVAIFLDQALESYGANSVVYICFGTFYWPSNPDHLWLLLDKLAGRGIPFILSHSSPIASIPEQISTRYGGSTNQIGLLCHWSPQQTILAHRACGWFVTHGGLGSTLEAITQGVPMIGWPFVGDQPINIAHCVHTLSIAYELSEVRTPPHGLQPIYLRNGYTPSGTMKAFEEELESVLDKMTGPDGMAKRANAKKVQEAMKDAWANNGPARRDLRALLDRFVPL